VKAAFLSNHKLSTKIWAKAAHVGLALGKNRPNSTLAAFVFRLHDHNLTNCQA